MSVLTAKALVFLDGEFGLDDLRCWDDLTGGADCSASAPVMADDGVKRGSQHPIVICADGGLENARSAGLQPTAVIGDFDSLGRAQLDALCQPIPNGGPLVRVVCYPVAKDKTDGQLAVEYAIGVGATEIAIFGALGGRFDHTLTNLGFLPLAHRLGARAEILDRRHRILYAPEGLTQLRATPGQTASLVPVGEVCRGITTSGLAYALKDGELARWSSRGNSNVVTSEDAEIHVTEGALWVVLVAPGGDS